MKSKFKLFILISCIFILSNPNVIHAYTTENGIEENDIVDLEFEGRLESTGEIFQPASRSEFEISIDSGFIEGFYEGVLGMKVDEDKTIIVPADKGYNNPETAPGKLFNQTLIFEVHIYSIVTNIRDIQTTITNTTNETIETTVLSDQNTAELSISWFLAITVFTLIMSQMMSTKHSKPKQ